MRKMLILQSIYRKIRNNERITPIANGYVHEGLQINQFGSLKSHSFT